MTTSFPTRRSSELAPDFNSPEVAKLRRGDGVTVAGQQGLWFQVTLADGGSGYLRVTDVRMDYAAQEGGDANVRSVFAGQAGKGRVTETAGVRGLDESTLKSASFDAGELKAMAGNRATAEAAASPARAQGRDATRLPSAAAAETRKHRGAHPQGQR